MRWFEDGGLKDEASEAYERYLREEIWERLPPPVRRLAAEPGYTLHDGTITRLHVDARHRHVAMDVAVSASADQRRLLRLRFLEAKIAPQDYRRLESAVTALFVSPLGTTVTQIRVQEVDIDESGRCVLRLGLWPFHQFAIHFRHLDVDETVLPEGGEARPGEFDLTV